MVDMFKPDYIAPVVGYLVSEGIYCLRLPLCRMLTVTQLTRRQTASFSKFVVVGLLRSGGNDPAATAFLTTRN